MLGDAVIFGEEEKVECPVVESVPEKLAQQIAKENEGAGVTY